MRKKSGFTTVELLVVVAALGILVVVSLQVGQSVMSNSRITGLINNFLADFSQAKLLAAAENCYVSINFAADRMSYTIRKQTDVADYTTWTDVKTVQPLSDQSFFSAGGVSNFAVNSTGQVRKLPIDISKNPDSVTLTFFIRKGRGVSTDPIAYQRAIKIFPYGGLKVEKQ